MRAVRVLQLGLGPIGAAALKLAAAKPALRIVGAVDLDPSKAGRDAGDAAGLGRPLRIKVAADLEAALASTRPDVVLHCTSSSITRVLPELKAILAAKAAVVSTTEELAYPGRAHAAEARRIDRWALAAHVAVLGTGVNPGFAMDALPIMLTSVCQQVSSISITRVQDARIRRLPFQRKIGAGLSVAEFRRQARSGAVRHVGLTESVSMIADACGWKLDRIAETIKPKIASADVASRFIRARRGQVCGIIQDGTGFRSGRALIRLHMEAYLGAPQTYDALRISGIPPLSMRLDGGIHGDLATPALLVNSIPAVLAASPGLHTMRDLRLPSFFTGLSR